ncbi:MAG: adenylate/guanylate cyclase domain-containing protein [bacterium]
MKLPFKLPHKADERSRIISPLIGFGLAALFTLLYIAGPLQSLYNFDLDFKFKLRQNIAKTPTNKDIMFIEIEETTLEWENTFPDDPIYYPDLIRELGAEKHSALATVFSIDYSRPFGRKVNVDVLDNYKGVLGNISGAIANDVAIKSQIAQNAAYYAELLGAPDANTYAGDIATKLEEIVFDQNLTNSANIMQQVAGFAQQESNLASLAPNREKAVAAAIPAAKNVYFTYDAKNHFDSPYDARDLKENPRIRKVFEKVMAYPTRNRPEAKLEGAVFDAYQNFVIKDFDYLLGKKGKAFTGIVMERIFRDRDAKAAELAEFHKQNDKNSFKIPPGLENAYLRLSKVKPVTPEIGDLTAGQGLRKAEFSPDDGTLRIIAPAVIYDGRIYPHMDLLLAMKYLKVAHKDVVFNKNSIILKNATHPRLKKKKDIVIPLQPGGTMLINWTGLWADTNLFDHMSLRNVYVQLARYDILERNQKGGQLSEEEITIIQNMKEKEAKELEALAKSIKNKIVIVGLTATGAADTNPTPLESRYSILGLHANVINTIIEDLFINRIPTGFIILIFFVLASGLGFVCGAVKHHSSFVVAVINFFLMVVVAAAYITLCNYLFIAHRIDIPMLAPVILIFGSFLLVFIYRFITEEQEKKKMKGMFSTYVNPQVVDTLIADPSKLKLGGETAHATVFFSDIAGFTTISESLSPELLVELLNEYLTAMTNILLSYGGTLDKYIGDAVLGIYGAPIYFPDHAKNCCFTAIDMQEKLVEMRKDWEARGKPDIQVRCGINTGDIIAGNMGSVKRFNYTAMGPAVDFGEHLESGGKTYDTQKSISEFTKAEADEHIITRLLDISWISGYEKPVKIYELIEKKSVGIPADLEKGLRLHEEAVIFYFQRKWDEALAKLEEVFVLIPGDPPSKKLKKRVEEAKANTPDESFDELLKQATHRQNLVF